MNESVPITLSAGQRRYLRGLAHARKAVVWIAREDLSDAIVAEIGVALLAHELIKVRLRVGDRRIRDRLVEEICSRCGAAVVQRVGNVATLYRPHPRQPVIRLAGA